MLKSYEKFNLVDPESRSTGIFIEVNWEPENEKINECKILRITLPDKSQHFIKRELLNELLFAIGKKEDQMRMIPQTLRVIRNYETVLGIKATKDIRKGEMINVPVKIPIPLSQEQIISRIPKK